ncbi:uncharacterized protein LOC126899512 [Daktulosphaira vitifoliae]|uniref:uncharacterized protein LOC126899512 n=1 Tax=Daktulosphaira vitifoliae TaxID=58002 RepID=UPI0021A97B7A|nr:uncharacterized protein LOC126899512 [Daktulosphaira vitifoliae]
MFKEKSSLVDKASKQNDVLFNLLSLKHKLLVPDQICGKCKKPAKDWIIIGVCHDLICQECIDIKNNTSYCPACNKVFDVEKHVTSNQEMKIAYSQMEEFVWKVLALEKGTLDNENEFKIEQNNRIVNLNNDDTKNTSIAEPNSNRTEKQFIVEPSIQPFSPKILFDDSPEKFKPKCLNFNNEVAMKTPEKKKTKLKISKNIKMNNSACINSKKISNSVETNLSRDKENTKNSIEEDVIEGTPEKSSEIQSSCSHKSHSSKKSRNKLMVLSYSNLDTENELNVLRNFMSIFNIFINPSWDDNITHLVVKTNDDGTSPRTKKCMNALLSNRAIVTLKWVEDCVNTKTLLPEVNYMPLEMSGEPSPMISWRVGRGIIDSPMTWANDCIIFVHNSIESNDDYKDILNWIKKAGFILTDSVDKINDTYSIRVVLADIVFIEGKGVGLPSEETIMGWIINNKVVTIYWDWMLECLFRYRFIKFETKYQIFPLTPYMVEQAEMSQFLFEFDDF